MDMLLLGIQGLAVWELWMENRLGKSRLNRAISFILGLGWSVILR